ncbi:MAG: hypothetical protein R3F20_17345 [Planctomycetota bacterium]
MSGGDRKRGVGCCGGCLIVVLLLLVVPRARDRVVDFWDSLRRGREDAAREEKRVDVEKEAAAWAREEIPELQEAIEAVAALRDDQRDRNDELRRTLEALGPGADEDPDLQRAEGRLAELETMLASLGRERMDAFVLWRKYRATERTPTEEALYREAVREGRRAAADADERLRDLSGR